MIFYVNPKKNPDHWNRWVNRGYMIGMTCVVPPMLAGLAAIVVRADRWPTWLQATLMLLLAALMLGQILFGFWCLNYAYKYEPSRDQHAPSPDDFDKRLSKATSAILSGKFQDLRRHVERRRT
jgi:hypothetical protein